AGHGSGGKHRAKYLERRAARWQRALDLTGDVKDVRVPLDAHEVSDTHTSEFGNSPDVIPSEIDEHDMFRAFFRIREELRDQTLVVRGSGAAGTRAGNGAHGDRVVLNPYQQLRRRAHDLESVELEVVHVRRRIERAQNAVQRRRVEIVCDANAAREQRLKTV